MDRLKQIATIDILLHNLLMYKWIFVVMLEIYY